MNRISFSLVNSRKLALQNNTPGYQKISYRTVSENLNPDNLVMFIESGCDNNDNHIKRSLLLYNALLDKSELSQQTKNKIETLINNKLICVSDLDSVFKCVESCKNIGEDVACKFYDTLNDLDNCDRIIRNESKLLKRFDLQKIINENIGYGCYDTVFELCSLIDTYSLSPKAKMNIALENVSYALFKSGFDVNLNEVTEYITEYFLSRDAIITDKDYAGYIDVLESNRFISIDESDVSYVIEAKNTKGNSYTDKLDDIIDKCETKETKTHISKVKNIKNEKQASDYIETSIDMIINEKVSKEESLLLLKSIYIIPLIGYVSKDFVNYKVELSKKKLKIKEKVADIQNQNMIRDLLDDGELIDAVSFVSESYLEEKEGKEAGPVKKSVVDAIKAPAEKDDSEAIDNIVKGFKASNEKSTSKFKEMLNKIMTKSPDNIINNTPNIFGAVRVMIYAGITLVVPYGPIFAAIVAFVNKLITMHLDLKQAEKLMKHLKDEKEKANKKLNKASSEKEKKAQEEYIATLDKCIKSVSDFISKIDDDNENIDTGNDDFGLDDDFNWESAMILESGVSNTVSDEILSMIGPDVDKEILTNLATIYDNCPSMVSDAFYCKIESIMKESTNVEACKSILENRGSGKLFTDDEPGFITQYYANAALQEISNELLQEEVNEATNPNIKKNNSLNNVKKKYSNLNKKKPNNKKKEPKANFLTTVKMAALNFKKKMQNLNGKAQELWRNIDIATNHLTVGIQKALTSDRREGIIKGSIIPSFSKIIKYAIATGAVGLFTGPVGACITALGIFGANKILNERERRLIYDEIDTELQVVDKQIQLAENEGDMNQYRFLLNYQKKLKREKYRIKYGMQMKGKYIPEPPKSGSN